MSVAQERNNLNHKSGFTLIELLVVIAIIGVLASVVLASLNSARAKSRDSQRMASLNETRKALELYYHDNGSYPTTGGSWQGGASGCYGGHGYGATGYIPGLVPNYMPSLPREPQPVGGSCFLYRSDGRDYSMLAHGTIETFDPDVGPHPMDRPCCDQQSIAVYSSGARSW